MQYHLSRVSVKDIYFAATVLHLVQLDSLQNIILNIMCTRFKTVWEVFTVTKTYAATGKLSHLSFIHVQYCSGKNSFTFAMTFHSICCSKLCCSKLCFWTWTSAPSPLCSNIWTEVCASTSYILSSYPPPPPFYFWHLLQSRALLVLLLRIASVDYGWHADLKLCL